MALKFFNKPGIRPIFSPPPIAYPRIVRDFYNTFESFTEENDEFPTFAVTIDDNRLLFNYFDIADALDIPNYKPMPYETPFGDMFPVLYCNPKRNKNGDEVPNPKMLLRSSFLHENMFLIDYVFVHLLNPIMHDSERPQYLWKYLHGIFILKKLDIPALMVEIIMRVRMPPKKGKPPPRLCYPRFITAILKTAGYEFDEEEGAEIKFDKIGYTMAKVSLDRLLKNSWVVEKTKDALDEEAPQEHGESSSRRATSRSTISGKEYKEILAAQAKAAEENETFLTWMYAQDTLNEDRERQELENRDLLERAHDKLDNLSVDVRALTKMCYESHYVNAGLARKHLGDEGAQPIFDYARDAAELADQTAFARHQSRALARAEEKERRAREKASSSRAGQGGDDDDDME